jgi:hypothetical protein
MYLSHFKIITIFIINATLYYVGSHPIMPLLTSVYLVITVYNQRHWFKRQAIFWHIFYSLMIYTFLFISLHLYARHYYAGSTFTESLKWTITHLIHPGMIVADSSKALFLFLIGCFSAIVGMIIFSTLFFEFLYRQTIDIIEGTIPNGIKKHLIFIGTSKQLTPLAKRSLSTFQRTYPEIKEVLLIVTDTDVLHEIKKLKRIQDKSINIFMINVEKICSDLRLNLDHANHIYLLDGFVENAGYLIAFVQKIIEQRSMIKTKNLLNLELSVEMNSTSSEYIFQRLIDSEKLRSQNIKINTFASYHLAAQSLLVKYPLYYNDLSPLELRREPVLIIDGWTRFAEAMILHTRSFGLYAKRHTQIYCVQKEDTNQKLLEFIGIDNEDDEYLCSLGVKDIHVLTKEEIEKQLKNKKNPITIVICGNHTDEVIERALKWDQRDTWIDAWSDTPEKRAHIFAELGDTEVYHNPILKLGLGRICLQPNRYEIIQNISDLEYFPKKAHNKYLRDLESWGVRTKDSKTGLYLSDTHNDWCWLSQSIRNWNYSTSYHLQIIFTLVANHYECPQPSFTSTGTINQIDSKLLGIIQNLCSRYKQVVSDIKFQAQSNAKSLTEKQLTEELSDESTLKLKIDVAQNTQLDMTDPDQMQMVRKKLVNMYENELFSSLYEEYLTQDLELQLIESLAHLEHDRWSSERYIQGWCYREQRNDKLMHHSSLIFFEKLGNQEKMKDRNAITQGMMERVEDFVKNKALDSK